VFFLVLSLQRGVWGTKMISDLNKRVSKKAGVLMVEVVSINEPATSPALILLKKHCFSSSQPIDDLLYDCIL
jgi:hypothetical protein